MYRYTTIHSPDYTYLNNCSLRLLQIFVYNIYEHLCINPRREMAKSYGRYMFKLLRIGNLFSKVVIELRIPVNSTETPVVPYPSNLSTCGQICNYKHV